MVPEDWGFEGEDSDCTGGGSAGFSPGSRWSGTGSGECLVSVDEEALNGASNSAKSWSISSSKLGSSFGVAVDVDEAGAGAGAWMVVIGAVG